jgi:hypothetical protein
LNPPSKAAFLGGGGGSFTSESSSLDMGTVFFRSTGADADAEPEVVSVFAFVVSGRDCRGLAGVDGFRGVAILVVAGVGFWHFT